MPRTDFTLMRCPVARTMAVLGERWAVLVLREAFYGATRFETFERRLGIAPNILAARLRALAAHGLLDRVPGPGARHEYRLTDKGRDFFPAYVALKDYADRWFTGPHGPVARITEAASGREVVSPPLLDATGAPLGPEDVRVLPGPGAGPGLRAWLAAREADRDGAPPDDGTPPPARPQRPHA